MNLYEHTIVARQDTSPAQVKQLTEKYSKIVEKNEGEIVQTEDWGLLNLAYIIKKNKKGIYMHFKIKGPGKIIDELETTRRKVYAGGIGYFSANGEFDTCIALRTAVAKNKKFYVQAGAGIVADSKPLKEYEETVNKAKALINALR